MTHPRRPAGDFNRLPSAAADFLRQNDICFDTQPDGGLLVRGDIDLSRRGLSALPDLSSVIVTGHFNCAGNHLKTLEGAPSSVGGLFDCSDNNLHTLKGAPADCGAMNCRGNRLPDLRHAPAMVGGDFICADNLLSSLTGAPLYVGGTLDCRHNDLASLKGAPNAVGRDILCSANPRLQVIDAAPRAFRSFVCDRGMFTDWNDMPQDLRDAVTRARQGGKRAPRRG